MEYLRVTIFACFLVYIDAQTASPKLTIQSPYYVNQSISISCDSGISTGLVAVDVTINNNEKLFAITCGFADGEWRATKDGVATDNCDTLPKSGNVNLVIRTQLTESMISSTVTCIVRYINGSTVKAKSDPTVNAFSNPYIAPKRLEFGTFEFDDNVPVLNKKIRAHCVSYGGYPTSQFIYEVRNTSDAVLYSTSEVKDGAAELPIDRHMKFGFKVTCRDEVHSNGEILLTRQNCSGTGSEICMPWFLEIPSDVQSLQKSLLNPSYSNSLKCAVNAYPNNKITYSWTSAGKVLPSAAVATYNLGANIDKEGATENLTCTASLDKYGNVTITWEIIWSLQATTTTVPGTSSASTAIGVGVGIGVALVVIAVVIGIILYKKKKDNTRRYQNTASGPASVTVDKHQEPTSQQTNNGGHPAYSKSDDHIIYTGLHQHILGNKQPQPAKPNPKCAKEVLYVKIYPDKTRKLTYNLMNYCSFAKMLFFIHSSDLNL